MHTSSSTTLELNQWKTIVQPYVASTHLPTYKVISAAPRPRCPDDDVPVKPVVRRTSSSSSSSSRNKTKRTSHLTGENLSKISMSCAREEDLDAPIFSSRPSKKGRARSETSMTSSSSSDLPSISEEVEA